nr:aminoglycoside adenylyltransferase domain-containing protein [Planosporangium thailandense]
MGPFGPVWAVLGVSRLHHTLATGGVISKTAAGEYARGRFDPRWHAIIDEALRIRRGGTARGSYRSPLRRRRDTLAFVDHVLDDACRTE